MIEVEIEKDVYLARYHHLLEENDIDIELLWGGRDSGKSKFVAQYTTEQCMSSDYFRCLLIKKTHESVAGAQWQMIKDTTEQWNVDHLFKFRTHPLSISCVNKNTFSARGMDNAGKIRSFTNPSIAWIEEGNQLTHEDFITILTGLRSDYGKVKLIITFNPEAEGEDYTKFWMYKLFFEQHASGPLSFSSALKISMIVNGQEEIVELKYRSTHVTYQDNPYVTPQRAAFHESLRLTNPYFYRIFTLGLWGNLANDSPWAYAFNYDDHVGMPEANPAYELYLSFDFNRNPACCSVIQHYENKIRVLETIKMQGSGSDAICRYILDKYPGYLYIVTGDYAGNTKSSLFAEEISNYTIIRNTLGIGPGQIQIKPNPRLKKNSILVNSILAKYAVEIHHTRAYGLIYDMQNVKRLADGSIEKTDRSDESQQADALDTFRYFCNMFMDWFVPMI